MNILLVEDVDIENGLSKIKEAGHTCLVVSNLEEVLFALNDTTWDAVLTDLHFPTKDWEIISQFAGVGAWTGVLRELPSKPLQTPPCGLAVVVMCKEKNIPVVVVSDLNHHDAEYIKIVLKFMDVPIIMDTKDWATGLLLLGMGKDQ